MNKKAIELSLNVIIIAIIGLLVLLVVSAIFLSRAGVFSTQSSSCEIKGGTCAIACGSADYKTQTKTLQDSTINCPATKSGDAQVCCLPVTI